MNRHLRSLPQNQIFLSLYLCNQMVITFYISNLDYFLKQKLKFEIKRFTTLSCKYIGIRKSEFVAKTHLKINLVDF